MSVGYSRGVTSANESAEAPRAGRRRGGSSTRAAVLAAARARFAADGYAGTTIRRIALDAGVDPSQVMQFFGSKDALFAAVMAIPADVLARFDAALHGADELLGERCVRTFLEAWEGDPADSEPLMAMLRSAVSNQEASAQLRDFLQERLLPRTAGGEAADRALRAGLAAAMLVGIITSRQIIAVPVVRAADHDAIVATVGPAIQTLLTGTTRTS